MKPGTSTWVGRAVVALAAAVTANATLYALEIEHDTALIALLAVAAVAGGVVTLAALDTSSRTSWTVRRRDARPETGEDTRTAMYRHVAEIHLVSHDADDAIVWQIADLARQRVRQLHGLRYDEAPEQVTELLGPVLADWVSRDRRHRYVPGVRRRRYSVAQLGDVVRRIEEL